MPRSQKGWVRKLSANGCADGQPSGQLSVTLQLGEIKEVIQVNEEHTTGRYDEGTLSLLVDQRQIVDLREWRKPGGAGTFGIG